MKVAIVHYWFVSMRGGEKVVEALCEMFPEADLFTHVYDPNAVSPTIARHRVQTTFIQRLPRSITWYQRYLPLMPMAIEQLDLRGYDLVVSSEAGPAKGVIPPPSAAHLCYCHSPMRYLWDMYHSYFMDAGGLARALAAPWVHYLRMWDVSTAARVDEFIANSNHVRDRVRKYYRRDAEVIYPPVDVDAFRVSERIDDYYLLAGQAVKYKRCDLAIRAFNQSGRRLVVIGDGAELTQLRRLARPNITFLGRQPFEVLRDHYSRCRALIFPGLEDFGIVPVEAMASGRPVVAYGAGGVLETVIDGVTGVLFDQQIPEALNEAVDRLESEEWRFDPDRIVAQARRFDRAHFQRAFRAVVDRTIGPGARPEVVPARSGGRDPLPAVADQVLPSEPPS